MGYTRPNDAPVSASWQSHKDRNPPSSEPGTDYASAYGVAVLCAGNGTVTDRKTSNGSATGRYLTVSLDDGRTVRYLHLSSCSVGIGERVSAGQAVAIGGASGYGSDWYYGPHVHTTLWPGGIWNDPTIDFDIYIGTAPTPTPILEDDEMILIRTSDTNPDGSLARAPMVIAPGYVYWPPTNEALEQVAALCSKELTGNARQFDLWMAAAQQGTQYGVPGAQGGQQSAQPVEVTR
jgi:murein DD-endopeptidase